MKEGQVNLGMANFWGGGGGGGKQPQEGKKATPGISTILKLKLRPSPLFQHYTQHLKLC